jgi:hypothetical protein
MTQEEAVAGLPPTESLLDVLMAEHAKGRAHAPSCVLYVATGGSGAPAAAATAPDASSVHAQAVQRCVAAEGDGALTGLLLTFPSCVVHLLEGRAGVLQGVLRDLAGLLAGQQRAGDAGDAEAATARVRSMLGAGNRGVCTYQSHVHCCWQHKTWSKLTRPTHSCALAPSGHLLLRADPTPLLQHLELEERRGRRARWGRRQQARARWGPGCCRGQRRHVSLHVYAVFLLMTGAWRL